MPEHTRPDNAAPLPGKPAVPHTCKTCRWWIAGRPLSNGQHWPGQCRRNPPVAGAVRTVWPATDPGDWCGEHSRLHDPSLRIEELKELHELAEAAQRLNDDLARRQQAEPSMATSEAADTPDTARAGAVPRTAAPEPASAGTAALAEGASVGASPVAQGAAMPKPDARTGAGSTPQRPRRR